MRQRLAPTGGAGVEVGGGPVDVLAHGDRVGALIGGHLHGGAVGVHPHVAQVGRERVLEAGADRVAEGSPAGQLLRLPDRRRAAHGARADGGRGRRRLGGFSLALRFFHGYPLALRLTAAW